MSRSPGRSGGNRSPGRYGGGSPGRYGGSRSPGRYYGGGGSPRYHGGHHGGYGGGVGLGFGVGALGGLALGSALASPYYGSYPYGGYGSPPVVVYDTPDIIIPVNNPNQLSQLALQNPGRPISYIPAPPVVRATSSPTIYVGPGSPTVYAPQMYAPQVPVYGSSVAPVYNSPYRY